MQASRHRLLSPGLKFIKLKHFSWQASWWHEKMYDSCIQETKTKIKIMAASHYHLCIMPKFRWRNKRNASVHVKISGQSGPIPIYIHD